MEKTLHYSIPEVKDIPLTADEQMIVELLTEKQIEIAKHPNKRKKWSLMIPFGDDFVVINYKKNRPRISDIVAFTLSVYHATKISNKELEINYDEELDRWNFWQIMIKDYPSQSCARWVFHVHAKNYYERKGDYAKAELNFRLYLAIKASCPKNFGVTTDTKQIEQYMEFLRVHQLRPDILDFLTNIEQFRIDTYNAIIKDGEDSDADDYNRYGRTVYDYVVKLSDGLPVDIAVLRIPFLIANEICAPHYHYCKKGSFDYNYAKAEKSDKEMQLAVAKAYREGIDVPRNLRLAKLWESFATGTFEML